MASDGTLGRPGPPHAPRLRVPSGACRRASWRRDSAMRAFHGASACSSRSQARRTVCASAAFGTVCSEQPLEDRPTWNPDSRERSGVGGFGDEFRHRGTGTTEFAIEGGFGAQSFVGVGSVEELERQIGIASRPAPKALTNARNRPSLGWSAAARTALIRAPVSSRRARAQCQCGWLWRVRFPGRGRGRAR